MSFDNQQDRGLLEVVEGYYREDPQAESVDINIMRGFLQLGNRTQASKENMERMANELSALRVPSLGNVRKFVLDVREDRLCNKLAELVLTPNRNKEAVEATILELQDLHAGQNGNDVLNQMDVRELITKHTKDGTLFGCESLRNRLGYGARPGHSIFIFARPDFGKTGFLIDCVATLVAQGKRVLYFQNEEPIDTTAVRLICRLTGRTMDQIARDPEGAHALAMQRGYGNIFFLDCAPGHLGQLNSHVRRIKPDVVVIDQLRNMTAQSENNTQRLEVLARGARMIGKNNGCIVIPATQAGDSATGKRILTMGDVDGSNTGIQGACDMMLGLGGTDDDVANGTRWASIPKAKIGGNKEPFSYRFNQQTNTVIG